MNYFLTRLSNLFLPLKLISFDISNALHEYQFEMASRPRERFEDPKRLLRYGYKVYSQNDEDGILAEIFRRVGLTESTFIEFGVGPYENNTLRLLLLGWRGLWLDGSGDNVSASLRDAAQFVEAGKLQVRQSFIDRDNINALIAAGGFQGEVGFLSIDLDGNDYWIWKAIDVVRPKVVCIEYNAALRPPIQVAMSYNATHRWDGSNYFGASLAALEELGRSKGYRLVGCNITGINAFFVREDLVGDRFAEPFTAENHYQAAKFFNFRCGHAARFGAYTQV